MLNKTSCIYHVLCGSQDVLLHNMLWSQGVVVTMRIASQYVTTQTMSVVALTESFV